MSLFFVLILAIAAIAANGATQARSCSIHCADGTSCSADDGITQAKSSRGMARDALSHRDEIARQWPDAASELSEIELALARQDDAALADGLQRFFDKVPAREVMALSRSRPSDPGAHDAAFVSCSCTKPGAGRMSQADCNAN